MMKIVEVHNVSPSIIRKGYPLSIYAILRGYPLYKCYFTQKHFMSKNKSVLNPTVRVVKPTIHVAKPTIHTVSRFSLYLSVIFTVSDITAF
jgi:hypothetical protein